MGIGPRKLIDQSVTADLPFGPSPALRQRLHSGSFSSSVHQRQQIYQIDNSINQNDPSNREYDLPKYLQNPDIPRFP